MPAAVLRTIAGAGLLAGLLAGCGSYYDELRPEQVPAGRTIEQAMGIAPKRPAPKADAPAAAEPRRVTAQQTVAARKKVAAEEPAPAASPASKLPVRSVAPTPAEQKPVPRILVHIPAERRTDAVWAVSIVSDIVPKDEMMRIVPYLPVMFADEPPIAGFEFLDGTIIIAERCVDEPKDNDAGCPAYEASIRIRPAVEASADPDVIASKDAIAELRTFQRGMIRSHGALEFHKCLVSLEECVDE